MDAWFGGDMGLSSESIELIKIKIKNEHASADRIASKNMHCL